MCASPPFAPRSLVASRTVAEHRQRLLSFKDEVAFDTNFANLPEAPGNKETVLAIAPVLKQAITASVNGTSLEVKVRPGSGPGRVLPYRVRRYCWFYAFFS